MTFFGGKSKLVLKLFSNIILIKTLILHDRKIVFYIQVSDKGDKSHLQKGKHRYFLCAVLR